MQPVLRRLSAAVLFTTIVACATVAHAAVVSSLAGNGRVGIADGPAQSASFVLPVGVAWDSKHRLYVSDAGAQRIRVVLPNGTVRTVAGSGPLLDTGLWVAGGFANGTGPAARFNVPMGIAVGPDDRVYIADSRNNCIRVMTADGQVSTFAGNPHHPGVTDGPLSVATFGVPVGVAVDAQQVVYVADSIGQIRRIADGQVSTLPVNIPNPLAVAMSPPNTTPFLWVTNTAGLWRIDLTAIAKGDTAHALARLSAGWYQYPAPPDVPNVGRLIAHGQRSTGDPFAVSVIDGNGLVYSDVVSHTVRYYNAETQDLQLVGGRATDDAARVGGGFEDGPTDQSRFDAPMGVAARSDGTLAVADSGNKRIRLISGIDRQQPFYPFAGVLPKVHFSPGDYRIALVGASIVWGDGPFSESVGGQIEKDLGDEPSLRSLHKTAKVMTVRMGSDFGALRSYVELLAEAGFVDAVVVQLSNYTVFDSYGVRDDAQLVEQPEMWQGKMADDLAGLARSLSAEHISVLFVAHPVSNELTLSEQTLPGVLNLYNLAFPDGNLERATTAPFARAHVDWLNAWPVFYADERQASHRPLYLSLDGHFTPYGDALLGKAIADRLAREKPWLRRP